MRLKESLKLNIAEPSYSTTGLNGQCPPWLEHYKGINVRTHEISKGMYESLPHMAQAGSAAQQTLVP